MMMLLPPSWIPRFVSLCALEKTVFQICRIVCHNIFWDISTFWDIDRTTLSITATFTYTRHYEGCRLVATVFISSEKYTGILVSVSVVSIGWWYESKNNPILILRAIVPWLLRTCSLKFNTKDPSRPRMYLLINKYVLVLRAAVFRLQMKGERRSAVLRLADGRLEDGSCGGGRCRTTELRDPQSR